MSGLALVELLVVLAIVIVTLGMGVPASAELLRAYRLRLAVNDLLGAVELARGQAIARGQTVLLVPTANSLAWTDGWTVFVDRDGDRRPGEGDDVIMRHASVAQPDDGGPASMRIVLGFAAQPGPPYLAYNSMGRGCSHANSLAPRFGTVTVFQGRQIRRIKINMLGRARLCNPEKEPATCAGVDP